MLNLDNFWLLAFLGAVSRLQDHDGLNTDHMFYILTLSSGLTVDQSLGLFML